MYENLWKGMKLLHENHENRNIKYPKISIPIGTCNPLSKRKGPPSVAVEMDCTWDISRKIWNITTQAMDLSAEWHRSAANVQEKAKDKMRWPPVKLEIRPISITIYRTYRQWWDAINETYETDLCFNHPKHWILWCPHGVQIWCSSGVHVLQTWPAHPSGCPVDSWSQWEKVQQLNDATWMIGETMEFAHPKKKAGKHCIIPSWCCMTQ